MNAILNPPSRLVRHFAGWLYACLIAILLAGCGGNDDSNLAVPVISVQPANAAVDDGSAATFSVTAAGGDALTYQWTRNGTPIQGATAATYTTPAMSTADSGASFGVSVSNAAGSVDSTTAVLTVKGVVAPPTILASPQPVSVVAGQTATFSVNATGGGTLAYQWTRNTASIAGATSPSYTTPATVDADSGTQFAVIVTNSGGGTTSDNVSLTVTPAPIPVSIVAQPANASVNAGQTAVFSVAATGTAPLSYQWSRNGAPIAGATGASYRTPVTVDADNGAVFNVVVNNASGPVTSQSATLTVTPARIAPQITAQPASVATTAGQAATFSVGATGSAPLVYQWKRNGNAVAGANAAAYTLATTTTADTGAQYTVTVSNDVGSVTSSAATLTVGPTLPPSVAVPPAAAHVVAGQTATFTVSVNGTPPFTYQWQRNSVNIAGATASSYTTPAVAVADTGAAYRVRITNAAGTVTSAAALLTVDPQPVPPTITAQPADIAVFVGGTATFRVTAAGTAPLAYQWRRNGTAIVGATGSSFATAAAVASDSGATFDVTVTNGVQPAVTSRAAVLTVTTTWTGIRQDGAPLPAGGTNIFFQDARAVATDAQGNVAVAGGTGGYFDATTGANGPFVAKYSAAGQLLWVHLVAGNAGTSGIARGVATDASGAIYVTGSLSGTLPGEVSAGDQDVFIAKFDAAGNRLWAHQFGSGAPDTANAIAVDTAGNAFIVGWSRAALPNQNAPYNEDYFIAKYDTAGNRLWLHQADFTPSNPDGDEATSVAVDAAGNAYLAGMRGGNNGGLSPTAIYVAKYSPAGVLVWTGSLAAHSSTNAQYTMPMRADGIAVAQDGSTLYVSGWTYADFDTTDNPAVASFCCTTGDAFIASFDGSGGLKWVHNLSSQTLSGGRTFDDEAYAVTTNASGSAVFVAGYTQGTMPGQASQSDEDAFVARYEADGSRTWIRQLGAGLPTGGSRDDRAYGIAMDRNGDLFVTGRTHGTFGTGISGGTYDDLDNWFVLKMKPSDGSLY